MAINRKPIVAVAAVAAVSMSLAACGGGSTGGGGSTDKATKGGTLYYLTRTSAEHMDPHRIYVGRDISNLNRIVYRGLVTFPISDDPEQAFKPVPDAATDTGTMSDDAKTWEFTIRDGVTWQDGKPVTCEDFKYGISRTFATDVITGGPNYILSYLDVPLDASGLPQYDGPYKGDHQADYDKAVTCDGNKLTLHFSKPWPDFNLAAASLRAFDPYRKDKDQGEKSNYQIFSNGPYKLEGKWDATQGGTFGHLFTLLLAGHAGIDLVNVPYKSLPQTVPDLLSGQLSFMVLTSTFALPHIKSGRLKALAVNTPQRLRDLPDVPTIVEAGFPQEIVAVQWFGFVAPAGTPREIVHRLNGEVGKALNSPEVIDRLEKLGVLIGHSAPEQFDSLIRSETERWARVIKARNLKAD